MSIRYDWKEWIITAVTLCSGDWAAPRFAPFSFCSPIPAYIFSKVNIWVALTRRFLVNMNLSLGFLFFLLYVSFSIKISVADVGRVCFFYAAPHSWGIPDGEFTFNVIANHAWTKCVCFKSSFTRESNMPKCVRLNKNLKIFFCLKSRWLLPFSSCFPTFLSPPTFLKIFWSHSKKL